ncbi:MAG: hypothetical protein ACRDS1_16475 [Pseudonocardiaceae bacterium]
MGVGEHGQALQAAKAVHPNCCPIASPQRIRHDVIVRETVADLLRQARRDAGGRELRFLAWGHGSRVDRVDRGPCAPLVHRNP